MLVAKFVLRRLLFCLFVFCGAFSPQQVLATETQATAPSKYKIRWLISHGPKELIQKTIDEFAKKIHDGSNGEMTVEIVMPPATISYEDQGNRFSTKVLEMVENNEYEMCQLYTTTVGNVSPKFWLLDLPLLFDNHEHAAKVLDGQIGKELLQDSFLLANNIRGLAFTYSGGFRVIPTRDQPIKTVKDFAKLKLSTEDSPVARAAMEALGAKVASVARKSIPGALSARQIDGFETTFIGLDGSRKQRDAVGILNQTHHSLRLSAILINEKFYRSLPEKYRALVEKTVAEIAQTERDDSIEAGKKLQSRFSKDKKIAFVSLPETEREKLRGITAPLAQQFPQYFSHEVVARIRAASTRH